MVVSYLLARERMVEEQLVSRGIRDSRVLAAMAKVRRHLFVGEELRDQAYDDYPLPIGNGQTISQPYMVALMVEALGLKGEERVLEVGTGSGYEAAVLAGLCAQVFSIQFLEGIDICRTGIDNDKFYSSHNFPPTSERASHHWKPYQ